MPELERVVEKEVAKGEERSIIDLVDGLITHAQHIRASDIHIDPAEKDVRVRMRVDA